MRIRIHGSRLVACNSETVKVFDIGNKEPSLVAERSEPSTLRPVSWCDGRSGPRVSTIRGNLFARMFNRTTRWNDPANIAVFDLALNEVARFEVERSLEENSLALSPDGLLLASVICGEGAVVFDARTGEIRREWKGHMGSGAAWSRDGRFIAVGDSGQGGGTLYLLDLEASGNRIDLPHPCSNTPLFDSPYVSTFSPDNALVAFSNTAHGMQGLTVYDVATLKERWSLKSATSDEDDTEGWETQEVAFACNGRVVLLGIEAGLRCFSVEDGGPLSTIPCEGADWFFAPDDAGRRVWYSRDGVLTQADYPADWLDQIS